MILDGETVSNDTAGDFIPEEDINPALQDVEVDDSQMGVKENEPTLGRKHWRTPRSTPQPVMTQTSKLSDWWHTDSDMDSAFVGQGFIPPIIVGINLETCLMKQWWSIHRMGKTIPRWIRLKLKQ